MYKVMKIKDAAANKIPKSSMTNIAIYQSGIAEKKATKALSFWDFSVGLISLRVLVHSDKDHKGDTNRGQP